MVRTASRGAVTRRRWGGIVFLMAAGAAAVLFVLLNPTWLEPIPPPAGKPLLTVLADLSTSMATKDVPGDRTRWEQAARIAQELDREMSGRFDVQLRTFAATPAAADLAQLTSLQPAGDSTDMARALAESIAADRPQGQALVLVGDGGHNAPGGVAKFAGRGADRPVDGRSHLHRHRGGANRAARRGGGSEPSAGVGFRRADGADHRAVDRAGSHGRPGERHAAGTGKGCGAERGSACTQRHNNGPL